MVHRQVSHHTGLDLDGLHVGFPFHLITGHEFLAVHHLGGFKHTHTRVIKVVLEDPRTRLLHIQSSSRGLLHPFFTVAIAIETDRLTGLDILTQHVEDGRYLIVSLCDLGIHAQFKLL